MPGSVPSRVRYSSVMQECLRAPVLCRPITLRGCDPGKGCGTPPVRRPTTPLLCAGTVPPLSRFRACTPTELRSGLAGVVARPLTMFGCF